MEFTVAGDDSGSSAGGSDTGATDDSAAGEDDAADSSLAFDSSTSEAGGPKDARTDVSRGDAPSDAPSDQKASTDAPIIRDAAIDVSACAAICSGCCDSTGKCQNGTGSTNQCGAKGALCVDCSTHVCPLPTYTACCTSAGACGCAAAGILCN